VLAHKHGCYYPTQSTNHRSVIYGLTGSIYIRRHCYASTDVTNHCPYFMHISRTWRLTMQIHESCLPVIHALNNGEISEEIIMASAAGWYLGTIQRDLEYGYLLPYSRDTDYMSKKQAEDYYQYVSVPATEDHEHDDREADCNAADAGLYA